MRARIQSCLRAGLLALALCALHGCGREREPVSQLDATEWLDQIALAHAEADLPAGEPSARLEQALALPVPSDVLPMHRRVAHQDLLFRIGRAELAAKHFDRALAAADRGLALGQQTDMFTGNLLIVRGEALEALGRATEAASAYYDALEINRKLLQHVLGEAQDAGPR
jgi:tetratricopeptide (TPR) repeat protein